MFLLKLMYYITILSIIFGYAIRIPISSTSFTTIIDILAFLLVLVYFYEKFKNYDFKSLIKLDTKNYILIFAIIAFLSLVNGSIFLSLSFSEFIISFLYLLRWILYSLIFFITIDLLNNHKDIFNLINFLIFVNLIIVIAGFIQLAIYPDFTEMSILYGWDPHKDRLLSTFYDPNYLAGFFAITAGLLAVIAFRNKKYEDFNKYKFNKLWILLNLFLTIIALVLTLSRSGLLAFMIILFIIFWYRSKIYIFISLLLTISIIINSEKLQDRIIGAFNLDTTSIYRVQSWQNAIKIGLQKPILGYGYNTIKYLDEDINILSTTSKNASSGSDSSLLNIFLMTGFLGLFFYLAIYLSLLRESFIILYNKEKTLLNDFALLVISMIIALFVHSWFVNSLLYPYILVIFWVIAGIFISLKKIEKNVYM